MAGLLLRLFGVNRTINTFTNMIMLRFFKVYNGTPHSVLLHCGNSPAFFVTLRRKSVEFVPISTHDRFVILESNYPKWL